TPLRLPARIGGQANRLLAWRKALRRALSVARLGLAGEGGATGRLLALRIVRLRLPGAARLRLLLGELARVLLPSARLRLALGRLVAAERGLALGGLLLAKLRLALSGLVLPGLPRPRLPGPRLRVGARDRCPARGLLRLALPGIPLCGLLACLGAPVSLLGGF